MAFGMSDKFVRNKKSKTGAQKGQLLDYRGFLGIKKKGCAILLKNPL
jgi:hypothetical protein